MEKDTVFCEPIGHIQKDGDYIFSWQPMNMSEIAVKKSQEIAKQLLMDLEDVGFLELNYL